MKYRKKPIVIEAWKNEFDSIPPDWLKCYILKIIPGHAIKIATLEGIMIAEVGDYIIKGVKGELYPCKPDIFKATYEKVD